MFVYLPDILNFDLTRSDLKLSNLEGKVYKIQFTKN